MQKRELKKMRQVIAKYAVNNAGMLGSSMLREAEASCSIEGVVTDFYKKMRGLLAGKPLLAEEIPGLYEVIQELKKVPADYLVKTPARKVIRR